jgi:hypothetical protein
VPTTQSGVRDVGLAAPSPYPANDDKASGATQTTRSDPDRHFFDVLGSTRRNSAGKIMRPRSSPPTDPDSTPVPAPNLTRWFHADSPGDGTSTISARQPLRIRHDQRIVFRGGVAPQARIQIATGNLAGTEIHLALTGTSVAAHLLTPNESSRQMLIAAMEVVREKLRARGVTVATVPAGAGGEKKGNPPPRQTTRGQRPRGEQS